MKTLITYFSAQGTTAKVAKELAAMTGADIFKIRPEKPYTAADLKWTNPLARCNREIETPKKEMKRISPSTQVPCFTAESMPNGVAKTTVNSSVAPVRISVFGMRLVISDHTEVL